MKRENIFRIALIIAIIFFVYQFGAKPAYFDKRKETGAGGKYWSEQLSKDSFAGYDAVIFGAEPQGISAALSAARLGADTLLISENDNIGGIISDCLIPVLELPVNQEKKLLNGGILEEMDKKSGGSFSDKQYLSVVNELLSGEENLKILYNTSITDVSLSDNHLDSLKIKSNDGEHIITAKMYIDASGSGALLDACNVPYFTGSGDLNMELCFMPVGLNFEMTENSPAGADSHAIDKLADSAGFASTLKLYEPLSDNVELDGFSVYYPDENTVLISGLKISGINVLDSDIMEAAYVRATDEAKNLAKFLSGHFEEFGAYSFSRAAPRLRVMESKHYQGKYRLTVKDIMDNAFFKDTVAMGSYPIAIGKFAVRGSFVAGRGAQYAIPVGCLVPEKITNLLMAGPLISYSSLAASSAGTIGTSVATGEAAGALAVFCAATDENPGFVDKDHERYAEFKAILTGKNMYLPDKAVSAKYSDNWSYPAARKLITLGLIAGGTDNNLRYNDRAKQKDLAFILINGIYRIDKDIYTKELDERLHPYITNDDLTFEGAVKILGALYGLDGETDVVYRTLCERRRINKTMQQRLSGSEILTMDEVYYLGAGNIQQYTGQDIPG